MVIRQNYIESLFCAIVTELDQNNFEKNKLYKNLCNVINSEGFNITFSEIDFVNKISYDSLISEYNNCFEKSIRKQNNNKKKTEFEKKFDIIKKIGFGGYGEVFEVKSLLDNQKYAVKKTYPGSNKNFVYLN
jgi:hypothetical protein